MGEITKLIATAKSYIGAKEGTKKYTELINAFEENNKYKYDGQGCCEIATAFFILALGLKRTKQLIPIINYANAQFDKWKSISDKPSVGALVYYGHPVNHVELVVDVRMNEMITIDGNSDHTVIERTRKIKDSNIAGYGVPDFKEDKEYILNSWINAVISSVELRKYSKGDLVLWLQHYLKDKGYYDGWLDGVWADNMQKAVLSWQKANNLQQDGVIGRYCWTYILK